MILVIVDILSKLAHFIEVSHPFTIKDVTQLFLDNVYKLHGFLHTIVSDRDLVCVNKFLDEQFRLQEV